MMREMPKNCPCSAAAPRLTRRSTTLRIEISKLDDFREAEYPQHETEGTKRRYPRSGFQGHQPVRPPCLLGNQAWPDQRLDHERYTPAMFAVTTAKLIGRRYS